MNDEIKLMQFYDFRDFTLQLYRPKTKRSTITKQLKRGEILQICSVLNQCFPSAGYNVHNFCVDFEKHNLIVARINHNMNGYKKGDIVGACLFCDEHYTADPFEGYFDKRFTEEFYIDRIVVSPYVRKTLSNNEHYIQGIGSSMMACVQELAKLHKKNYVTLLSVRNKTIEEFYEHRGMLKSRKSALSLTKYHKIIDNNLQSYTRMLYNVITYMQQNGINTYNDFVTEYRKEHNPLDICEGCEVIDKELAGLLTSNAPHLIQSSEVLYSKKIIDEIFSVGDNHKVVTKYLYYMSMYTPYSVDEKMNETFDLKFKDSILRGIERTYFSENPYLNIDHSVLSNMSLDQIERQIEIFNAVNIHCRDRITTNIGREY